MNYIGIALSGKAASGKDTVCNAIYDVNENTHRYAFADALKTMATSLTDVDMHDPVNKKQHRGFLIQFGQAMREFNENYWVDQTIQGIEYESNLRATSHRIPIITDVRFVNEAEKLAELGYYMVRLECNPEERTRRGSTIAESTDSSECELDNWPGFHDVFHTDVEDTNAIAEALARHV